jgi:SPP1 gp7 family putative phage head morphogenesis protein
MIAGRYTLADLHDVLAVHSALEAMKSEIADFIEQHQERTGVVDFLDVPTGDAFDVRPEAAIAYFRAKGLRPSFHYADMMGAAHDQAFTVAKMMDVDMLGMVRSSLDDALANGMSFGEWKKGLEPILKSAGWWGEQDMLDPLTGQTVRAQLGSPWRLETIFRTNLQTSYAAGQWAEIEEQAELAPYLMYDAVDDLRTRVLHREWDQTVLPVTSKWWNTHYPPCGYNCRCGVIQLSYDDLAQMGLSVRAEPPSDGTYRWRNPRTDVRETIPNGVDPGFDHNSGKSLLGSLRGLLDDKISALPPDMQPAAIAGARRAFDSSTEAGRWHGAAFDDAPDWIREAVLETPDVLVEAGGRGAFAQAGRVINMGDLKIAGGGRSATVWRHEFGHIMDSRRAAGRYRSSEGEFPPALHSDAAGMTRAAGKGRKSKALDKEQATRSMAYEKARDTVVDAALGADGEATRHGARMAALRELAKAAGVDFDKFVDLLPDATLLLADGARLTDLGVAARVARMLAAVGRGDVEEFLRAATFKDAPELGLLSKSWRLDGALNSLSDLAGSATRNKVASYHEGFAGHSDGYYGKSRWYQPTEAFANLTALAGHPKAYWWDLAKKFAPAMTAEFERIMRGQA